MDILDNLEEYTRLITSVGLPKNSVSDFDMKIDDISDKLNNYSNELERIKESQEMYNNNVDSKTSQICIDLELNKKENEKLIDEVKVSLDVLLHEVDDLKDYKKNMEDYKKVTNERIEKLLKLFLSIINK